MPSIRTDKVERFRVADCRRHELVMLSASSSLWPHNRTRESLPLTAELYSAGHPVNSAASALFRRLVACVSVLTPCHSVDIFLFAHLSEKKWRITNWGSSVDASAR
jgi:hypothetical protein